MITKSEQKLGVKLDYTHKIADSNFGLLMRYNRIFSFLNPNNHVPALAYHIARLRGAIAADCGTCVEIEINLAQQAGIEKLEILAIVKGNYDNLSKNLKVVAQLSDAVVGQRQDDMIARQTIIEAYGDSGLIELSYAMNGAALLPGIKRSMGYATACNVELFR